MNNVIMTRYSGIVEKGWGQENIFVTNDLYCGKILTFHDSAKSSMHYHLDKHETWYCLSGEFVIHFINTHDASQKSILFSEGDVWTNAQGLPHQLECIKGGDILEVSTPDSDEDNYRVLKGDSQK